MRKIFLFLFLFNFPLEAKYVPHIIVTPLPKKNEGLLIPSTILSENSLEKSQQTFIGSALNQAPGITSASAGTEGSVTSIKFRGAEDRHTLVVIDGIPVNDPGNLSNAFNFGQYRAVDVKSISILPGSQSLLYGSNAIGGVVVIDTISGEGDTKAKITQELGTYHLSRTLAQTSGQMDKLSYMLTCEKYRIGEGALWNRKQQLRQSDDYHDYTGSLKLGFQATPCFHLSGYLTSSMDEVKNNLYTASGLPVESNIYKTKSKSHLGYVRINWKPTEKSHHLLTVSKLGINSQNFNTGTKSGYDATRNRLHHLFNYQINENNLLQLAFEYEADGLSNQRQENHQVYQNHFVGTYEFKPAKIATLGFGVRETYHKTYKHHTTYQISGKLTFEKTELFASFGTGFRSPSLFQIYGSATPNLTTLPNKDLKPERSQSFDGGVEQVLCSLNSKVRLTYFVMQINDIILYQMRLQSYKNVNQRITHGLEGTFKTDFTPDLNSQVTYTYTRGIDSDTKRHPLRIPQHKLGVSLYYCPKNWSTFIEGTYVSHIKDYDHKKVGAYFVMRIGTAYEINNHIKVFGRVENLLDRVYEQTFGYATRGRSFLGGVHLKL